MAALKKFGEAKSKFAGEVDFIIVYISEAHPTDEWSFDFKGQPQVNYTLTSIRIIYVSRLPNQSHWMNDSTAQR